jgi:hypothetical protein
MQSNISGQEKFKMPRKNSIAKSKTIELHPVAPQAA